MKKRGDTRGVEGRGCLKRERGGGERKGVKCRNAGRGRWALLSLRSRIERG